MDKLNSIINALSDKSNALLLFNALKPLYDEARCQMLTSAGLVITATAGKYVPKTGAAISYGVVKGYHVSIAAGTDMPALAGTVTNTKFNVFCFFANKAATSLTSADMVSAMGTEGASLDLVKFPGFPEGKTLIGYVIINPTGAGNFVGGSTALDDVTVVPNTVYVSLVGAFNPNATFN